MGPGTQLNCAIDFLVADDKTGVRYKFHLRRADGPLAFGSPWVLFGLSAHGEMQGLEVYNVVTHRTQRIHCGFCLGADGYAIGARWLELDVEKTVPCENGTGVPQGNCGANVDSYYDLVHHTIRRKLATTSDTTIDLNSAKLVRPICPPLSVPPHGSLTFYGTFAVATAPAPQGAQPNASTTLEECRSQVQTPLDAPFELRGSGQAVVATSHAVGNTNAVAWAVTNASGDDTGEVDGVLLPRLVPFSFTLPPTIVTQPSTFSITLAMDAERLYVIGDNGDTWSAPFP